MSDRAWRLEAACRGVGPDIFFPTRGEEPHPEAVLLCDGCPVRAPCLEAALENREMGRWGGTSEKQRRQMREGKAGRRGGRFTGTCEGCGTLVARDRRPRSGRLWCAAPECRRAASVVWTRNSRKREREAS